MEKTDFNNMHEIIDDTRQVLISIVVPCYNSEKTLARTVDSLLEQRDDSGERMKGYEVILVDDGSTDATGEMCDRYSGSYENVLAVHKDNGGLVDAWKSGVNTASGKYIAFCDSDDYLDNDFVFKIRNCSYGSNAADIIVFGMILEYSNGETEQRKILLEEGVYSKAQLDGSVYPRLLSNGPMQSELLGSSRCNKVFKKALLQKIQDDIPNSISYGEDDITCFASILNSESIAVIQDYYPYHYVRDNTSMIGGYDTEAFLKIETLFHTLLKIAETYDYRYTDQIKRLGLSLLTLGIKKEISRNPNGFTDVKNKIRDVKNNTMYSSCFKRDRIKNYKITEKIFILLVDRGLYIGAYWITRSIDKLRGRNV